MNLAVAIPELRDLVRKQSGRFAAHAITGTLCFAGFMLLLAYFTREVEFREKIRSTRHSYAVSSFDYFVILTWLMAAMVAAVVLTTAVASLTREKQRKTLDLLFTTQLTSAEIVVAKLLAPLAWTFRILAWAMPLAFILAALGSLPDEWLVRFVVGNLCWGLFVSSLGILAGVWSRQTAPATVAAFGILCLGVFLLEPMAQAGMTWLSPLNRAAAGAWLPDLRLCFLSLAGSLGFIVLAAWRLKPAWERQQAKAALGNKLRLASNRRSSAVGSRPFRWKERYFADPGPFVVFSFLPPWILWTATSVVSLTVTAFSNLYILAGGTTALLLVFFALLVALRGSTQITSEFERDAWDSICLTNASSGVIVRGKFWGMFDQLAPYWIAMFVGAIVGAAILGWERLVLMSLALPLSFGFSYYALAEGLRCSARSSSGRQAMATTIGYVLLSLTVVGAFFIGGAPITAIITLAVGGVVGFFFGPAAGWIGFYASMGFATLVAVGVFFSWAEAALVDAEKFITLPGTRPRPFRGVIHVRIKSA